MSGIQHRERTGIGWDTTDRLYDLFLVYRFQVFGYKPVVRVFERGGGYVLILLVGLPH